MESKRQQKFARLLQRDLSDIFQKDAKHLFNGVFVTITGVRVSPDLGVARVYLSFLMEKNRSESLENIKEHGKTIRQLLAAKIRHQVRVIPELVFFLDETAEYAAKMDELIGKLNIPPADPAESDDEESK